MPSWKKIRKQPNRVELIVYWVFRWWGLSSLSKRVLKIPLPPVPLMLSIGTARRRTLLLSRVKNSPVCHGTRPVHEDPWEDPVSFHTCFSHELSYVPFVQSLLALVFRSYCYMICDSSKLDSPPTQVQILPKIDSSRAKYKKNFLQRYNSRL